MLYNNDVRKVENLDQLLINSKLSENCDQYDDCAVAPLKDFQKDYLLHLIPEEVLDEVIRKVQDALSAGKWDAVTTALAISNPPTLYKGNLVFGMHKYLHWFRGYYYQMSYTPNGIGSVNTPYYRMAEPMRIAQETLLYCSKYSGVMEFILSLSALTTALNYYDRVKVMLSSEKGIKEFDTFLRENWQKHHQGSLEFDTQKVLDCFSEKVCHEIPSDVLINRAVILGQDLSLFYKNSGKQTVAILSFSEEEIIVVTKLRHGYRVLTFTLPEWYTDSSHVYEDVFESNPYKDSHYTLGSLVQFTLLYAGVHLSSTGFYHMRKDVDRNRSILVNLPVVWDACQLDDFLRK